MKTVKVICYPAKVHVIRPSDVHTGKLVMETATDWVTRGHLRYVLMSMYDGGSMYSRANVNLLVSIAGRQSDA